MDGMFFENGPFRFVGKDSSGFEFRYNEYHWAREADLLFSSHLSLVVRLRPFH